MKNSTYTKLIDSLTELLKNTPYDELTITDLCSHACVTRRTFYKNFKSIDALVQHFFLEKFYKTCCANMNDKSFFESDEYIHTMVYTWDKYGDLIMSLDKWDVLEYLTKNNIYTITKLIKEKISDEFIVNYSEYFIISTYSLLSNICMMWLKRGKKETPEELIDIIYKFVYHKSLTTENT